MSFYIKQIVPVRAGDVTFQPGYFGLVTDWSSSGHGLVMVWFYQLMTSF